MPDILSILRDPATLDQISPSEVPDVVGAMEALKFRLLFRLVGNPTGEKSPAPVEADTLLTAKQAAPLLNVTPHWLYRHARQLPFTRRLSRKVLRFSESGLRRWQVIKRS